jgi:hypothetical protein
MNLQTHVISVAQFTDLAGIRSIGILRSSRLARRTPPGAPIADSRAGPRICRLAPRGRVMESVMAPLKP